MRKDSLEISADEDLITPERLAKGDLEVATNLKKKIRRVVPRNLTLVKELIRRGVFPYHYEIYGVGFLELRAAFLSPWAARSSAVLLEQWGVGVSNSRATVVYQNVLRNLGFERIPIIHLVMEEIEKRAPKQDPTRYVGGERRRNSLQHQKECFERLVSAMDEERSRIYEEVNKLH